MKYLSISDETYSPEVYVDDHDVSGLLEED